MGIRTKILAGACLLAALASPAGARAAADPNMDAGGGGMGGGSAQERWVPGDEGVRVSVIRTADAARLGRSADLVNAAPAVDRHGGAADKLSCLAGAGFTVLGGSTYRYDVMPDGLGLPTLIPSASRPAAGIGEVREYFRREDVCRWIAEACGVPYGLLSDGSCRILAEPVAYLTHGGARWALTATQAALLDLSEGGRLRRAVGSFTHQNLPLSLFLEEDELGIGAWKGPRSGKQADGDIVNFLGVGIVRFANDTGGEAPPPAGGSGTGAGGAGGAEEASYRTDTDVFTSVTVSSGTERGLHAPGSYDAQAYPGRQAGPVSVSFQILGATYTHGPIWLPEGGSQLAWAAWHTPSYPCDFTVRVTSDADLSVSEIRVRVRDAEANDPPDPQAGDRFDAYRAPAVPGASSGALSWGEWACAWEEDLRWVEQPHVHTDACYGPQTVCGGASFAREKTGETFYYGNRDNDGNLIWCPRCGSWECPGHRDERFQYVCASCGAQYASPPASCTASSRRLECGLSDRPMWIDFGEYAYAWKGYRAWLGGTLEVLAGGKAPTAQDGGRTMRSGYGLTAALRTQVLGNAPAGQATQAQTAVMYFPEFGYAQGIPGAPAPFSAPYWRVLERDGAGAFQLAENPYSAYGQRVHFTPVWYPDGAYAPYAAASDAWTPAGMLRLGLPGSVTLAGSVFDDWHIAPAAP
ncbi:MAG: hypothetical protein LBQ15_02810 [Clostridium sp.]|jgi:hypothetical protein|nr:hypothetical protein [Clostridium sp.]